VLLGQAFFVLVAERDLASWIRDQALGVIFTAIVLAVVFGFFDRGLPDLSNRGDRR
jgi:hypothetical protein